MVETADQILANYRDVRARLRGTNSNPVVVIPRKPAALPAPVKEPEQEQEPAPAVAQVPEHDVVVAVAPAPIPPRLYAISAQVCHKYGITQGQLFGRSVRRVISSARKEVYYRAHEELKMSLANIGRYFRRDHTTIAHGIKQHKILNKLEDAA